MKMSRKGVTLIELILSLALIGVIIQVIYSMFFVGNTSFSISTNRGFSQQEVRILADLINTEFKYVTDISQLDNYVEEYYSINIVDEAGKKAFIKTKHTYNGDGTEEDKGSVTDTEILTKILGHWDSIIFSNDNYGEINVYIKQFEGINNKQSFYELPIKISTINKNDLISGILNHDLVTDGPLFYKNKRPELITEGIDIGSETNDDFLYSIDFYIAETQDKYFTIQGKPGDSKDMPDKPGKEGFYFKEWNRVSDGSGESYSSNKITIPAYNMKLYAIWTEESPPEESESLLTNLDVNKVEYKRGNHWTQVYKSGSSYNVGNNNEVRITVSFDYNKPTSNLELIVTGQKTSGISETEKVATIITSSPSGSNGTTKDIEIEIREKNSFHKSVKLIITLKNS